MLHLFCAIRSSPTITKVAHGHCMSKRHAAPIRCSSRRVKDVCPSKSERYITLDTTLLFSNPMDNDFSKRIIPRAVFVHTLITPWHHRDNHLTPRVPETNELKRRERRRSLLSRTPSVVLSMLLPLGAAAGVLFATSTYGSKATTARVPLFQVTVPRTCTTPPRGCRRWPSFYVTGRYSSFCQPEAQPSQRSLLATTNRRSQTAAVAVAGRLKLLCTSQQQQEHQSRFVGGEGDDGGGLLDIAGEANDVGRGNLEEYTSRCAFRSL